MSKNKGFTLIELLVVIAIIGILAAAALASLGAARTKGQEAAVKSQMANMRAQAELFFSTTGGNTYGESISTAAGDWEACGTAATLSADSVFGATAANNGLASLRAGVESAFAGATLLCANDTAATADATTWAVSATLPGTTASYYCVDSAGFSGVLAASPTTTNGLCQ